MSYKILFKGIQAAAIGSVGYVTYDGSQKILEQRQSRLDQIEAVRSQIEQEREKLDKVLSDKVVMDIIERNAHEVDSRPEQKTTSALKVADTPKHVKIVERVKAKKEAVSSTKAPFEVEESGSVRYLQDELMKVT